ncbi:MAG TPA: metallophosphoesterase [Candidatus Acidoferrales bacterium]|nr:metallophosphoesterase [Candidatus Acidoferrales bacterium]
MKLKRRKLAAPRPMTGKERRWLNPNRGLVKVLERRADYIVSRFVYPHLLGVWNPYSWLLPRRFSLAEISLSPAGWPAGVGRLQVLLLSDIHTGIFLKPPILAEIIRSLMELEPDMVAIAGDVVTAKASDLDGFLPALAPLSRAPLGAWFCLGNHDYFDGDPSGVREALGSAGISTLCNDSVVLPKDRGQFVLGGLDDRIFGKPDWNRLVARHGPPHVLLAHHPDFFYEAVGYNIPLILSGHTHGGQIRFPQRAPLIRQSQYCLDEGAYRFGSSILVVSRGLGSVGLPWRYGADPEAILIDIVPSR